MYELRVASELLPSTFGRRGSRYGLVYAVKENSAQERFLNNLNSGASGTLYQCQIRMGGNKNDRHHEFSVAEFCYEINAINSGKHLVDDETITGRKYSFVQQLLASRVSADYKSLNFKREFQRFAHSHIVIDDDDKFGLSR